MSCVNPAVQSRAATSQDLVSAIVKNNPNAYRLVNANNSNAVIPDNWRKGNKWRVIHSGAIRASKDGDDRLLKALLANGADTTVRSQMYPEYSKELTPAEMLRSYNKIELAKLVTNYSGENYQSINQSEEQLRSRSRANRAKENERYRRLAQQRAEQRKLDDASKPSQKFVRCSGCGGNGRAYGGATMSGNCVRCGGKGWTPTW